LDKNAQPFLSVIVITFNEAARIEHCLSSVAGLADEIIVLDSGSEDQTVSLARQYTDKVFVTDWPGFGPQKQRALEKASGQWVLSIDADESISQDLAAEIRQCLSPENPNQVEGYWIPRLTTVCGQAVKHGGWYPDYLLRLVRREQAYFSKDTVHEQMCLKIPNPAALPKLRHPIQHDSYDSLDQLITKFNLYSTMGAEKLKRRGVKGSVFKSVIKAIAAFLRSYVFKRGFLDGGLGFVIAVSSAESAYYKYLKLAFDQEGQSHE